MARLSRSTPGPPIGSHSRFRPVQHRAMSLSRLLPAWSRAIPLHLRSQANRCPHRGLIKMSVLRDGSVLWVQLPIKTAHFPSPARESDLAEHPMPFTLSISHYLATAR